MIIPSSNGDAATCIHGIGYSYLNGALAAAGFLTLGAGGALAGTTGTWLAGDFTGSYPKVRGVQSSNDGPSGQAGTTRQMARIMAVIKTRALVDSASSAEMEAILMEAASGLDRPWGSREPSTAPLIPRSKYVYNKLGLASLKPDSSGPEVRSECSLIKDPVAASRQYVVAWQNMQGFTYSFADISQVIIDTITQFEI